MGDPKRILMIPGSNRAGSLTVAALKQVAEALERQGIQATLWDMRAMPLPPYDPEGSAALPPVVEALKSEAARAAGFVLGSPTYHNSYSGLLKTALDHLSPDDFRGKPVALVGVGSVQPLDHLRIVVRGLLGVAIPTQFVTGNADFPGGAAAPALTQRVERLAEEMVFFIERLG